MAKCEGKGRLTLKLILGW